MLEDMFRTRNDHLLKTQFKDSCNSVPSAVSISNVQTQGFESCVNTIRGTKDHDLWASGKFPLLCCRTQNRPDSGMTLTSSFEARVVVQLFKCRSAENPARPPLFIIHRELGVPQRKKVHCRVGRGDKRWIPPTGGAKLQKNIPVSSFSFASYDTCIM